jgi:isopenicillin N synthase-like dioxygenase
MTAATERPATLSLAADEIPILDLGPLLAGEPGAVERLAGELRYACTEVGFYYVKNHGIPQAVIDRGFAESARFHALPLDEKLKLKVNRHKIGYIEMASAVTRHTNVSTDKRPNLYAAYCVRRDLEADDPDVLAGKPFCGPNQWPSDLPGFREGIMGFFAGLQGLGETLLPLYAAALDLPRDYFQAAFEKPLINFQLNYYPHQESFDGSQFGVAPHTDLGFMTILAQAQVPGLEIGTRDGRWVVAPVLPGHFLINTGDMLRRWTNDLFLSTPHRVINTSRQERYSVPFFYNPNPDTMISALPTCVTADHPALHEPMKYIDLYEWFVRRNYPTVVKAIEGARA